MAVEKYIHGKRDEANHAGLASNWRAEAEAYGREELAMDLLFSMQVVRTMRPEGELYEWHRRRLEFWGVLLGKKEGIDKGEEDVLG